MMQVVYHATDVLEAHIVAGMLRAHEIEAYVDGHYLQGGVGELAAAGFASVSVNEAEVREALLLIQDYQNAPSE